MTIVDIFAMLSHLLSDYGPSFLHVMVSLFAFCLFIGYTYHIRCYGLVHCKDDAEVKDDDDSSSAFPIVFKIREDDNVTLNGEPIATMSLTEFSFKLDRTCWELFYKPQDGFLKEAVTQVLALLRFTTMCFGWILSAAECASNVITSSAASGGSLVELIKAAISVLDSTIAGTGDLMLEQSVSEFFFICLINSFLFMKNLFSSNFLIFHF